MRTTRLLLLTGTVLPGLLIGQTATALTSGGHDAIMIAQGGPGMEREPRGGGGGGGEGPRGGPAGGGRPERGGPERAAPERGAPPAARERPEPRPAPAQERSAPAREPAERATPPAPRERPVERPAPAPAPAPAPRQEAPRAPTPAPERAAPPAARERAPQPAEQPARRQPPAPAETAPQRAAPAPAVTPRTAPEPARPAPEQPRPAAPPAGGEKAAPNAAPGVPGRPVQRPDAAPPAPPPGRTAPPAGTEQPNAGERGTGQRGRQPGANQPSTGQPGMGQPGTGQPNAPAPNAAPGVPGRPVQGPANPPPGTPPNVGVKQDPNAGAPQPGGPAPNATPPNMQPGVPGRPVGQPPASVGPNGQGGGAYPPDGGPGGPGRPGAPGAGVQPGYAPGQPGAVPTGRVDDRGVGFNRPGRPGYVPGGFRDDDGDVRDYSRIQRDRREYNEDGRTYIREPGRIIVQDRGGYFIRHDENERFRDLDRRAFRSERRGADTYTYLDRPGGEQIVTVVDDDGRMLRRYRRFRDGREVTIIDNGYGGGPRRPIYEDVVDLPPPDIRIPRERYVVNYEGADERSVYEALAAPPVVALDRRYSLDQVRNSPQLRARMRSVDIDTITFESGSFTVTSDQAQRLSTIAAAINQAVRANPQEVFLIEGYTDAVGADVDNLSLSDRRAQSVATVLTQTFQVPPENLTTQGYGEQYLKVNTQSASRENRRVTVRRITPLIQQGQAGAAPPPR